MSAPITEQQLRALRSVYIYDSLMALTLGARKALTKDSIKEIADNYEQEVQRGAGERYEDERQRMQAQANVANRQLLRAREFARKKSRGKARACVWPIIAVPTLLLLAGIVLPVLSSIGMLPPGSLLNSGMMTLMLVVSLLAVLFTFLNLWLGTTVRSLYRRLYNRLYHFFLKRKSFAMGVEFEEFSSN